MSPVLSELEKDLLLNDVLRAAGSELRHYTLPKSLKDMRASVDAIEQAVLARVVERLKDAERYQFIRNPEFNAALILDTRTEWVPPDDAVPGVGGYWIYEYRTAEELDEAIDTAMAIALTNKKD